MSSFKNFAPMLSSLQDQADGTGTIAGSPLEDFLSIAGYETPGGGGGGSSDFSTSEVTVVNNVLGVTLTNTAYVFLDEEVAPNYYEWETQLATSDTYSIVLYKGVAYVGIDDGGNEVNITVSGNIEYDSDEGMLIITGNGTITINNTDDN